MPCYFFEIDNGTRLERDGDGTELSDDQAATEEASRTIAQLAKDCIPGAPPQRNITTLVRGKDGTALLQLGLSFTIQPLR
jgi:hypothetical protein